MSTIAVVLRVPHPSAGLIKQLRDATGMPVGDIRVALQSGSPLLLSKLFLNDHDDRASELRKVIQIATDHGVSLDAFESLEEGETYHCIDLSHVLNILAEWEQGLDRLQDFEDERGRG